MKCIENPLTESYRKVLDQRNTLTPADWQTHTLRITDLVCSEQKWSEIKAVYCPPLVNTRPSSPIVKSWHTVQSANGHGNFLILLFQYLFSFSNSISHYAIWLSPCPHLSPLPDSSLSNTHRWPLKKKTLLGEYTSLNYINDTSV